MAAWWWALLDLGLLAIGATIALVVRYFVPPFERGFFCGDESIRYPYHDNTVSEALVVTVSICVPVIFCVACEAARFGPCSRGSCALCGVPVPRFLTKAFPWVSAFLCGALITHFSMDVAKRSLGRLRPHFIDVCRPNVFCEDLRPYIYVDDYKCMGGDEKKIIEARLSFPSGHAAFTFYGAVFIMLYAQERIPRGPVRVMRPILQLVLFTGALYTALSRISDNMHHPSDVLAGSLLGVLVAVLTVTVIVKRRKKGKSLQPVKEVEYRLNA